MNGNIEFIRNNPMNVWFMAVGKTGTGKSTSFEAVGWVLRQVKDFPVLSGNVTKASFLDYLEESYDAFKTKGHPTRTLRSYACVYNDEWTDVMPGPDQQLISAMIKAWGDQDELTEIRRHSKRAEPIKILKPTLTVVGGIQPEKFKVIFPAISASEGFSRRMLLSFEQPLPKRKVNLLQEQLDGNLGSQERDELKDFILVFTAMFASRVNVKPDQSAADVWGVWTDIGDQTKVTHLRAEDWNTTRDQYIIKIAGLFATSRHFDERGVENKKPYIGDITMNGDDLLCGIDFVRWCEQTYLAFYASQVEDWYKYFWAELAQYAATPRTEDDIKMWMSEKVPSFQIKSLFDTAKETKRLRKFKITGGVQIGSQVRYQANRITLRK